MELCEVFAHCGLDVVAIAAINAAVCIALKRTVLKGKPRASTALAYILGAAIYAVYASANRCDALYIFEELSEVVQKGVTIGTATMVICAAADRFNGGSSSGAKGAVAQMLEGMVGAGAEEDCAAQICSAAESLRGEELAAEVRRIVGENGGSEDDALCALIAAAAEKLCGGEGASNSRGDGQQTDKDMPAN